VASSCQRIEEIISEAKDVQQRLEVFRKENIMEMQLMEFGEKIFAAIERINQKIDKLSGGIEQEDNAIITDLEKLLKDLEKSIM